MIARRVKDKILHNILTPLGECRRDSNVHRSTYTRKGGRGRGLVARRPSRYLGSEIIDAGAPAGALAGDAGAAGRGHLS